MTVSVSTSVTATYSNSYDFCANPGGILREETLGGVSLCAQASVLACLRKTVRPNTSDRRMLRPLPRRGQTPGEFCFLLADITAPLKQM